MGNFFPDFRAEVSSANISVRKLVTVHRSFIKHKNKMGPKMLPCKTDIGKFLSSEKVLLISSNCFLLAVLYLRYLATARALTVELL